MADKKKATWGRSWGDPSLALGMTGGGGMQVGADLRRARAVGDYDVTAKEAQRKAAAYGRARGNA